MYTKVMPSLLGGKAWLVHAVSDGLGVSTGPELGDERRVSDAVPGAFEAAGDLPQPAPGDRAIMATSSHTIPSRLNPCPGHTKRLLD
jgi:hypothetical protein